MEEESKADSPAILYKYLTVERAATILKDHKAFFASPTDFNDPFDCALRLKYSPSARKRRGFWRLFIKDHAQGLNRKQRRLRERETYSFDTFEKADEQFQREMLNTGMFCLSELRDNILMWSHYAGQHTGVCVGLRVLPRPVDLLPAVDSPGFFGTALPVNYSESYPEVDFFEVDRAIRGGGEEAQRHQRKVVEFLFLTKAADWKYEKEWRVVACFSNLPLRGKYSFPKELIVEVVFGCRTSDSDRNTIEQWLSESGAKPKLLSAQKKDGEFGLEIADE